MAFDLTVWKATVRERLVNVNWRQRMAGLGVNSLYASLCASTLWPVVQAATGGDISAGMALGGVLAGVGSNLVANRIQDWKDEADAARQITAEVSTDLALRDELDAVLQTLDAVTLAKEVASKNDRIWLVDTLRRELTALGNLSRFEAHLQGSGAIAQGRRSAAAGKRAVANTGKIVNSVIMTGDVYAGPPTRDPDKALMMYYQEVVKEERYLSLRGLDVGASDATGTQQRPDLTQVYIDLLTTTQGPLSEREWQQRKASEPVADEALNILGGRVISSLSALNAVREHQHLVVLGDPGSGKSMFLRHFALCMAAQRLEPGGTWLQRLTDWTPREVELTPIFVTLREFARWLPGDVSKPEAIHLWTFIKDRLERKNLAAVAEPLLDCLNKGSAILLFDGLDEMPSQERGTVIRDAIQVFSERHHRCRTIVTCRTLSYADPDWQLRRFERVTLAPFNEDQIDRFIAAWYAELARLGSRFASSVEVMVQSLREAVRYSHLKPLASNPLLLTAMALVHTHKGQLPEARALLYEETIDVLLWRWEQMKVSGMDEVPRLRQLLAQAGRTDADLKRTLWQLAFVAHENGGTGDGETVADIGEAQLEKALSMLHPDRSKDWAGQVIEVMKLRAGLLLERAPEVYTFPHRTFQEYLAGAYLASQSDFAQQAARLAKARALWREVILLAVGRLVYRDADTAKPLALIAELCPSKRDDTDVTWRQTWLAGDVLLEMGLNRANDSALGRELVERVSHGLVALLRGGHLSSVERARAGDTLARVGDSRFRADAWYLPDEPLLGFVEIPAEPFLMGSDPQRDPVTSEDERPQHLVSLPRYYIARYPVTVAQFRIFVEQSGYQPSVKSSLDGFTNSPVVYVSWHEALAYCEWLTKVLREWGQTPEPLALVLRKGGRVTLPSEAEWEKAARGTQGLIYPWGNDW